MVGRAEGGTEAMTCVRRAGGVRGSRDGVILVVEGGRAGGAGVREARAWMGGLAGGARLIGGVGDDGDVRGPRRRTCGDGADGDGGADHAGEIRLLEPWPDRRAAEGRTDGRAGVCVTYQGQASCPGWGLCWWAWPQGFGAGS